MDAHRQLRGEGRGLARPGGDQGERRHHEGGAEHAPGVLGGGESENLHGLAEPHVVGQDGADTRAGERRQPAHALELVGTEGGDEPRREVDGHRRRRGDPVEGRGRLDLDALRLLGHHRGGESRCGDPPATPGREEAGRAPERPRIRTDPLTAELDEVRGGVQEHPDLGGVEGDVVDHHLPVDVRQLVQPQAATGVDVLRAGFRDGDAHGGPHPGPRPWQEHLDAPPAQRLDPLVDELHHQLGGEEEVLAVERRYGASQWRPAAHRAVDDIADGVADRGRVRQVGERAEGVRTRAHQDLQPPQNLRAGGATGPLVPVDARPGVGAPSGITGSVPVGITDAVTVDVRLPGRLHHAEDHLDVSRRRRASELPDRLGQRVATRGHLSTDDQGRAQHAAPVGGQRREGHPGVLIRQRREQPVEILAVRHQTVAPAQTLRGPRRHDGRGRERPRGVPRAVRPRHRRNDVPGADEGRHTGGERRERP